MCKKLFALFFIFALSIMQFSYAQEISRYPTVMEALEVTTDYEIEINQLEVLSEKPLHIRVSPEIVAGDHAFVIDEELKRALVYTVLRTFIHTDVDRVKVTVQPLLVETYRPTFKAAVIDKPKYTIDITRDKARAVIQRLLNIDDFKGLVGVNLGDGVMADLWKREIEHIFYNDQQAPGLDVFFKELGAK